MELTDRFYAALPVITDFLDVCAEPNHAELPANWCVVVTDIVDSTAAIANGHHKEVNALAVASIMAVLNAVRPLEIPYAFGGDGATLCVPESTLGKVRPALATAARIAEKEFGLRLRCGVVAVPVIVAAGRRVLVARHRLSPQVDQAMFRGGGLAFAVQLVKDPERGAPFRVGSGDAPAVGDFSGFECRWQEIPSPNGETISLLVRALDPNRGAADKVYRNVVGHVRNLFGTEAAHHPVRRDHLELTAKANDLASEVRIRAGLRGTVAQRLYGLILQLQVRIGRFLMARGIRLPGVDWGAYKDVVVTNTNFRGFDDRLYMLISGPPEARDALHEYLEVERKRGSLAYGMHSATAARMTCIIFNYAGEHVHFVDGVGGGYTMAARELKRQTES